MQIFHVVFVSKTKITAQTIEIRFNIYEPNRFIFLKNFLVQTLDLCALKVS